MPGFQGMRQKRRYTMGLRACEGITIDATYLAAINLLFPV
jgi:hypothetical protein